MGGLIGRISFQGAADPLPLGPLQHRGPDASGAWFSGDGRCWLGHTRLPIQGLSEDGAQPITIPVNIKNAVVIH